jgi:hypothetical protein
MVCVPQVAMTCGYRVFVYSNMAFSGDFTPVLAKHSKSFSLVRKLDIDGDAQANPHPRHIVQNGRRPERHDAIGKLECDGGTHS